MAVMPSPLLGAALAARAAGLSVIPIKPDGSKEPLVKKWAPYQAAPADEEQLHRWFGGAPVGLAVVAGQVSGGLEMIEFEGRAVAEGLHREYRDLAEKLGLGELLTRVLRGMTVTSPTGGLHVPYRCAEGVEGNLKLARRPAPDGGVEVLIETRGEGGYFITYPSNGTTHATGGAWVRTTGGFGTIATITEEERRALLDLARTFDRMPRQVWQPTSTRSADGTRPGDDFNAKATWPEILEPHGWTDTFTAGDGNQHWRRPGKNLGTSATISDHGEGALYVFTSSSPFDSERAYSKFGAYAVLNHGGDFNAAARELAAKGYGSGQVLSNERPKMLTRHGEHLGSESERLAVDGEEVSAFGKSPIGVLMSEVEPETLQWLWAGRIPAGKLVVLDGDPGLGKSTMTLDLAARISRGLPMPMESTSRPPAGVVILSAEDGLADTIQPRLAAAGADLDRILAVPTIPDSDAVNVHQPEIPFDLPAIREAIQRVRAEVVVIDPLMSYLGSEVNSHRDQDIRRVLFRLAGLAEEERVTVLVVRHLNKATGGNPLYRGGGSIGIIGAARSGLLVAADPDDDNKRVMAVSKYNLTVRPPALSFQVITATNGVGRIEWLGTSEHTASTLLAIPSGKEGAPIDRATAFLEEVLRGGPVARQAIDAMRRAAGISDATLRRAKDELGVEARKDGLSGPWLWYLSHGQDRGPKALNPTGEHLAAESERLRAVTEQVSAFGEDGSSDPIETVLL